MLTDFGESEMALCAFVPLVVGDGGGIWVGRAQWPELVKPWISEEVFTGP